MQKITPHLWFDKNAEEAVNFYIQTFRDGKVLSTARYTEAGKEIHGMDAGTVMSMEFEIEGYRFVALNGGPLFKFNPSISFLVARKTVEEVDELWGKLSEGGQVMMELMEYPFSKRYGWASDKYGVSWQVMFDDGHYAYKHKITPTLMFVGDVAGKAEEAMNFYASIFPESKVGDMARYPAGMAPEKEGTVMHGVVTLAGQEFFAMDSANEHKFNFNEAISLLVTCKDQAEIDHYWGKLSAVPEAEQCGWLKDKYGVSWQVVPAGMEKLLNSPDKEKAKKAMNAVLQMKKFDMAKLKEAIE